MIDAATTRDRDDAIEVTASDDGWIATVHVACVADHVRVGCDVDGDAARRGASVYLPDKVIPMLGARVEAAATLTESAPRSALSVRIEFDADGELIAWSITRTELPAGSCAALTHTGVSAALADAGSAHHYQLLMASRLANVLMGRRRSAGAFVVYDLVRGVVSTEDGRLVSLPAGQNATAYVIVQELLIAANSVIAGWAIERDVPILFRNHRQAAVAPEAADRLAEVAAALSTVTTTAELAAVTDRINLAVGKATYEPVVHGHYGLQLGAYTHATSPLRRYADLVTQRIICAALDDLDPPYGAAQLGEIGSALTELAQARAERRSQRFKTAARRESAAAIATADFAAMGDRDWLRIIKLATGTAPNDAVIDELLARADAGRLHPGHVAQLLDTSIDGWVPVRAQVFDRLREHQPHVAATVLSSWGQMVTGAQPGTPTYETVTAGPPHARRFAVRALFDTTTITGTVGDGGWPEQIVGDWHTSVTKKTAEQQALWDVLGVISGHQRSGDPYQAAPLRESPPPPRRPAVPSPADVTISAAAAGSEPQVPSPMEQPVRVPPSAWTPQVWAALGGPEQRARKRKAGLSNPIGWLITFALAVTGDEPEVVSTHTGPPHAPEFTVTITAGPAAGTGTGRSVQKAKRVAATAAITAMFDAAGHRMSAHEPVQRRQHHPADHAGVGRGHWRHRCRRVRP